MVYRFIVSKKLVDTVTFHLISVNVHSLVDFLNFARRHAALRPIHVLRTEEKLSIQIRLFNQIIIGERELKKNAKKIIR